MPLHLRDPLHGHEAHFHTSSPSHSTHLSDVRWGPSSISVPSTSPLNGPADVYLRLPNFSPKHAQSWCKTHKATYLGPWCSDHSQPNTIGFAFRVPGFSRYRYVESDEDEEDDQVDQDTDLPNTQLTPASRRRTRVQAAGRTPLRPSVRQKSPGRTPARKASNSTTVPTPTPRRRMTPSIALYDSDEEDYLDDADVTPSEQADLDASTGGVEEADSESLALDPFKPLAWASSIDTPAFALRHRDESRITNLKAALFDQPYTYGRSRMQDALGLPEPQLEEEDVAMEDVTMREEEDDEPYDVFEQAERREVELVGEGEAFARPEAGDFVFDGADIRKRRPAPDMFFPPTSLPFPTADTSVAAGNEGVISDTGLMLGRSTRVSFSQSGLLVWPCYGSTYKDSFSTPGFVTDVTNIYSGSAEVPRESLSKMLRVHCGAWYGSVAATDDAICDEVGERVVRKPTLEKSFSFPEVADATIAQFVEELKFCHEEGGDVNALHAHVALSMLLALYKQENDTALGGDDTLLRRIAIWADGPAGIAFDDESNCHAAGLRSALINLTLGRVEEAVALAAKAGHLRLSLLIARALESPKDDLRADAIAQLEVYGLRRRRDEDVDGDDEDVGVDEEWEQILQDCPEDADVSLAERMILLVLAGHVASVAKHLGMSWYRLFIMEFFHGKGSSDLTQAERVSAAVDAINDSKISTLAPHGCAQHFDVVYHLLRLYADPTASYSLTSGVYANGSFGAVYSPLDARFSWLTYQILTAVIPQASTPNAPQALADEFSSQLRAAGLHLWSFYVLCSGGAPADVMKRVLLRDWPSMVADVVEWTPVGGIGSAQGQKADRENEVRSTKLEDLAGQLGAESFLKDILGVPRAWIAEAKAVAARVDGDTLEECKHWLACGTEEGALRAHELITTRVFPGMAACQDTSRYSELVVILRHLEASKHVSDWSTSGGLILHYLEYVFGIPHVKRQSLTVYRGMVNRVCSLATRASTPEEHHAAAVIADGVAIAERSELFRTKSEDRESILEQLVEDLERLPCSKGVRLRVAGEYRVEMGHGRSTAQRLSMAYPPYVRFVRTEETANA